MFKSAPVLMVELFVLCSMRDNCYYYPSMDLNVVFNCHSLVQFLPINFMQLEMYLIAEMSTNFSILEYLKPLFYCNISLPFYGLIMNYFSRLLYASPE